MQLIKSQVNSKQPQTARMTIRLFNTLTNAIEELLPADGEALRIYACGPTVYDYGHIGNFRTFLHVDILRRVLELQGTNVRHVMNITDVDDKIIRNAAAAGVPIGEYTPRYEKAFFEDLDALSVEHPEIVARATEHIPEMVALIQRLAEQGLAYKTNDGSWYFRIAGFPEYGKLSKKDFTGIADGARVDVDEYDKDSARDFALWKAPKPGEYHWQTDLGPGRPGWHIECSAMAMEYLGESFDLHAGGEDLMFPHHENEIAQSRGAGREFARLWTHNGMLELHAEKMSKSVANVVSLRGALESWGREPILVFFLNAHYRSPVEYSDAAMEAARAQVADFRAAARVAEPRPSAFTWDGFRAALDDDFDTPRALSILHAWRAAGQVELLGRGLRVFGLVIDADGTEAPLEAHRLAEARQAARRRRDFRDADRLRSEIDRLGWDVQDVPGGAFRLVRKRR